MNYYLIIPSHLAPLQGLTLNQKMNFYNPSERLAVKQFDFGCEDVVFAAISSGVPGSGTNLSSRLHTAQSGSCLLHGDMTGDGWLSAASSALAA